MGISNAICKEKLNRRRPSTRVCFSGKYSNYYYYAEVSKFSCWHRILEGRHRNEALRKLTRQHPDSFSAFTWTVLLLKPAPVHALRAFARNIIGKEKPCYTIASTLYDSLFYLREDNRSMIAISICNVSVTALCAFAAGSKRPPSSREGLYHSLMQP